MQTKFIVATAAIQALTATSAMGAEFYPVTNPQCNVVISQPDNSSGYYLNNDCTAAFILPPRNGKIKVERVAKLSNLKLCPALDNAYNKQVKYQDLQEKFLTRLADESLTPSEREETRKDIEVMDEAISRLYSPFERVPGAVAQVTYTTPSVDEWIGEFLKRNPNLGADIRMKFHPATISESVLVIKSMAETGREIPLDPVVDAFVPGLKPIANDPNRLNGTAVIMNGHLSGQLTLGLTGACAYAESGQKDLQDLVVHMVGNVTYAVPVLASVGYTSTLDSETAIRNLVTGWQTKSQFNKTEGAKMASVGSAGDAFHFAVTDHELKSYTDEERAGFFAQIREEVRLRLTGRLVEQMTLAGFLEMSKPAPAAEADDPGYLDEVHLRRECSGSSGFFGIGAKHRCHDIPYVIKVPYTTSAEVLLSKINNTSFTNEEHVMIRAPIYRTHSGTFMPDLPEEK